MQDPASETGVRRTPPILEGKVRTVANQAHQQSFQAYQTGLQLMQEGKFEKARTIFEKLIATGPVEVLERCRVYLSVCHSKLQQSSRTFATHEEQYDYAISLLNEGLYEDAREQLEGILKKNRDSDYAHYGLAVMHSMTGQTELSLEHLSEAIRLNPQNRIHARGDSDFQEIIDDPRFTEMLYPEVS